MPGLPGLNSLKRAVVPLAILLLFAGAWYGLLRPEYRRISELRGQPESHRQQIEGMMHRLGEFREPTEQERLEWVGLEERLRQRLPQGRQLTGLYSLLSTLAGRHGLRQFTRVELPDSARTLEDGGITRQAFDLELNFAADYKSLLGFLEDLRRAERLIDVVRLEVEREPPLVTVRMVIRSHFLP